MLQFLPVPPLLALIALMVAASSSSTPLTVPDLEAQNTEVATLYAEGRYADAIALTHVHLEHWATARGKDSHEYCSMHANLGILHTMNGDLDLAEPAHRDAIDCLRQTYGPDSDELASALNNYGHHLGKTADFGRAELALRESLRLLRASLGDSNVYVAITLNNLAMNQQNQGNLLAAERTLTDAVARLRAALGDDHPSTATAVNNLGRLLARRGTFAEAEPLLREALAVRRATLGPEHRDTQIGRRDLGRMLRQRGDLAAAEALFRETLRDGIAALGDDHPDVAMSHHELGRTLVDQKRYADARMELQASLDLRERLFEAGHSSHVELRRELGAVAFAQGDLLGGRDHLVAAAEAFELGRTRSGEGLTRATYLDSPYFELAALQLLAGDEVAAWQSLERAQARVLIEALRGHNSAIPPVVEPLAVGTAMIGWLDVDLAGTALAWAWIRRDGKVHWHRLDAAAAAASNLRGLRQALAEPGPRGRLYQLATAAWRDRVAPLADDLHGATHLVVVPSRALLGIPLEALLDADQRWLSDCFTISYTPSAAIHSWLGAGPVRGSGPALLVGDPPLRAPGPGTTAIAVTDAPPSDAIVRGAAHGLDDALASLPPLPGSRREVTALAERWPGSTVLLGAEASEARLVDLAERDALRSYRTLHFATHALVDADDADASVLVLSQLDLPEPLDVLATGDRMLDGLITSADIATTWRLDADLVTLSACATALGREVTGEGLVGFPQAFLTAGARAVLVSQWSVPDRATALFMARFYVEWRDEGRTRAEALAIARRALRDHRDEAGRRPYEHPYYWAAFVLVGDER